MNNQQNAINLVSVLPYNYTHACMQQRIGCQFYSHHIYGRLFYHAEFCSVRRPEILLPYYSLVTLLLVIHCPCTTFSSVQLVNVVPGYVRMHIFPKIVVIILHIGLENMMWKSSCCNYGKDWVWHC